MRGWRRRRWRGEWFGWHHSKSSPLVKDPGTTSPAQAVAPGTEKAHRAQPADGTMEASKSNQTSNPVFAITIDWSINASDTNVKVSALQPWLRRTVI